MKRNILRPVTFKASYQEAFKKQIESNPGTEHLFYITEYVVGSKKRVKLQMNKIGLTDLPSFREQFDLLECYLTANSVIPRFKTNGPYV